MQAAFCCDPRGSPLELCNQASGTHCVRRRKRWSELARARHVSGRVNTRRLICVADCHCAAREKGLTPTRPTKTRQQSASELQTRLLAIAHNNEAPNLQLLNFVPLFVVHATRAFFCLHRIQLEPCRTLSFIHPFARVRSLRTSGTPADPRSPTRFTTNQRRQP